MARRELRIVRWTRSTIALDFSLYQRLLSQSTSLHGHWRTWNRQPANLWMLYVLSRLFGRWIRDRWIEKPTYFYCSTTRTIEVESLIIKDAYNTRIGLTLIDISYHLTPSYYEHNWERVHMCYVGWCARERWKCLVYVGADVCWKLYLLVLTYISS